MAPVPDCNGLVRGGTHIKLALEYMHSKSLIHMAAKASQYSVLHLAFMLFIVPGCHHHGGLQWRMVVGRLWLDCLGKLMSQCWRVQYVSLNKSPHQSS